MRIPNFTKDLSVIQKLSDLPNATDGLSAEELKAKFDEAGLEIQKWLNNTFIPALKAENLPFTASEQLNANNVQDAIRFVFEQISDASSGTIANGSVSKEKLSAELLARVFGGRAWVSLNKPTADNNQTTEFPIGQVWLKPGITVTNMAGSNWFVDGCTAVVEGNKTVVTGDGTVVQTNVVMNLPNIGFDGDRVYVLFGIKDKNAEITSLTVSLNGGNKESTDKASHEARLSGGSLSVSFLAEWPSTSLAVGSYTIENMTVVNVDQIMRQTYDCKEMTDWESYLISLLPLTTHYDPRAMYIQTASGVWQQFDYEVSPVEKGGTGNSQVSYGEMLYGTGTSKMERIPAAETNNSVMQFVNGKPQWSSPDEASNNAKFARASEDTYTGTGVSETVQLPGKPAVLWLRTDDETVLLFQGTKNSKTYKGLWKGSVLDPNKVFEADYTAGVELKEDVLNFYVQLPELAPGNEWLEGDAVHYNEEGKQYTWTAIY